MNIYYSSADHVDYDEFESFVIAANSQEEAERLVSPYFNPRSQKFTTKLIVENVDMNTLSAGLGIDENPDRGSLIITSSYKEG